MSKPNLSVVIPVYRSSDMLRELFQEIRFELERLDYQFEVLFVEDGGGDHSWQEIQSIAKDDPRCRGMTLSRNYGQHNALLCGCIAATGEIIVTMDDDLQHPARCIESLLKELDKGYDVVYGTPEKQPHGLLRGAASVVTKWVLSRAMGGETASQVSAFRVFRQRLVDAFRHYRSPYVNLDVMLTWGSTRFSAVRVEHRERARGQSGYTVRMLCSHALNMMTGFSSLPLKIASVMGLVFSLFGFLVLLYVVLRFLFVGAVVPGFGFIASIVAIFSGVQLLAIGIIGEYISRIHFRTMDRPAFVVKEVTSSGSDN